MGQGLSGALPCPAGLLIMLAKGLWFRSSEAVFGSWLAIAVDLDTWGAQY